MQELIDIRNVGNVAASFRFLDIPSLRGNARLIRIDLQKDGNVLLVFKSIDITKIGYKDAAEYESCMHMIPFDDYLYVLQLLDESGFWDMQATSGESAFDGNMTMFEATLGGNYHCIFDVYERNTPMGMLCRYLMQIGHPYKSMNAKIWPLLGYYSTYDEICLEVGGAELAKHKNDFNKLSSKLNVRENYGDPHEVQALPDGSRWGYYLKDRGMMEFLFDRSGEIRTNGVNIIYSEYGLPEIKREWLKPVLSEKTPVREKGATHRHSIIAPADTK